MSMSQYVNLITSFADLKKISREESASILINAIQQFLTTAESWSAERSGDA